MDLKIHNEISRAIRLLTKYVNEDKVKDDFGWKDKQMETIQVVEDWLKKEVK